jgi:hypothetical protein
METEFKVKISLKVIVIGMLVSSVAIAGIVQLPILGIVGIFMPDTRATIPQSWAGGLLLALVLFGGIGLAWAARLKNGE